MIHDLPQTILFWVALAWLAYGAVVALSPLAIGLAGIAKGLF